MTPGCRMWLALLCHAVAAMLLLAPLALMVLVDDKTHAAVAAVAAVVSVRFLEGDLVAWLTER